MSADRNAHHTIAQHALGYIADGNIVGLGTGHAATAFIRALGDRVQSGLKVRGVPTSQASADLARQLKIPLVSLDEVDSIDVDVDGADEVDPQCNLIKGYGGALLREKIVAAASRKILILVGPEKIVPVLGSHGKLPVEVVPFGRGPIIGALAELGCTPQVREQGNKPFVTDNGNLILDCKIPPIEQAAALELAIPRSPASWAPVCFCK